MALAAGTRLGPYEIHALIGAGGMGEVYRAHDMRLDRDGAARKDSTFLMMERDRVPVVLAVDLMRETFMNVLCAAAALFLIISPAFAQSSVSYEVFAVRFAAPESFPLSEAAVGGDPKQTVALVNMVWLLKGSNGKNVLVDTGFIQPPGGKDKTYVRPDAALGRVRVSPGDIADVIITHPHFDHIDGIDRFPKATLWMQKDDYDYFVGAAWQKGAVSGGFEKEDVRKIVEANLSGRLRLVKGDDLETLPGIRVFTGSKHTWESQYLVVRSQTDPVLLASDAIWFYYNLEHLVPIPTYTFDAAAYVQAMKKMTTLVPNRDLIIPGHDANVFEKFPRVAEGVVRIR
jgi:glyoxylase-like metal-dependent hydrolase (beta-lactamase superfamily II)